MSRCGTVHGIIWNVCVSMSTLCALKQSGFSIHICSSTKMPVHQRYTEGQMGGI